jgi:hypothetical protein
VLRKALQEDSDGVLSGELPFERFGRHLPLGLEVAEATGQSPESGKIIIRRQNLSQDDREADLDLAGPPAVHWRLSVVV